MDTIARMTKLHALILLLALVLFGLLLSIALQGMAAALLISVVVLVTLWFTKPIWLPPNYGQTLIGRLSLLAALSFAGSYPLWGALLNGLYSALIRGDFGVPLPMLPPELPLKTEPSFVTLLFLLCVIYVVNDAAASRTILAAHPKPLTAAFPEKTYLQRLLAVAGILRDELDRIDRQTRWSVEYYTPIDAEVEVRGRQWPRARILDLQVALRRDKKTRLFLVLGDPGAGKSVALRKLCRDMLREVPRTGRLPVYLNLKEWSAQWSEASPPSAEDVLRFAIDNLKSRGDIFADGFIDEYFTKMLDHGRLFFVFDSFDEIPAVLDATEDSWVIDALSRALSDFVFGAHESSGIVASRLFRRPTDSLGATKVLEIRPFSDDRIATMLARFAKIEARRVREIFVDRPDLVAIARNPFSAALIGTYLSDRDGLPANTAELYGSYLSARLEAARDVLDRRGFTVDEVLSAAQAIAVEMYEDKVLGIEADVGMLEQRIPRVFEVAEILIYCRLCRAGTGGIQLVSFVHRRFAEYLVARGMLETKREITLDAIPADSRWREVLVLYAQLVNEHEAQRIAEYCWSMVQLEPTNRSGMMRVIHSLRFMVDAFSSRPRVIGAFRDNLGYLILKNLSKDTQLLVIKFSLEAAGLVNELFMRQIILATFQTGIPWLGETALRSCRYVGRLDRGLRREIDAFVLAADLRWIYRNRQELSFSLRLSDAMRGAHRTLRLREIDLLVLPIGVLCTAIAQPFVLAFMGGMLFVERLMGAYRSEPSLERRVLFTNTLRLGAVAMLVMSVFAAFSSNWGVWTFPFSGSFTPRLAAALEVVSGKSASERMGAVWIALVCGAVVGLSPLAFIHSFVALTKRDDIIAFLRQDWREVLLDFAKSGGGVILVVVILLQLPEKLQAWVLGVFAGAVVLILAAALSFAAARESRRYLRDLLLARQILYSANMSRQKIAGHFLALRTEAMRRRYIRQLEMRGVKAFGEWPDGFEISAALGSQAGDLARLEERWLSLSR
jgi:hypothetical protein